MAGPSHYLKQCWNIGNWTLKNKLKWNISRNTCIFFSILFRFRYITVPSKFTRCISPERERAFFIGTKSIIRWSQWLTHWGRVTHICVSKLTIIGSNKGLSPGRPQAIIWTNAGIMLIGPLGTNFSEILIEIYTFLFKKMHLKMSSGKWPPSCLGLNVLSKPKGYGTPIPTEHNYAEDIIQILWMCGRLLKLGDCVMIGSISHLLNLIKMWKLW